MQSSSEARPRDQRSSRRREERDTGEERPHLASSDLCQASTCLPGLDQWKDDGRMF